MSLKDKYTEYKEAKREREEDLKKRNPERLPTKMNLVIRIIAGGYLVYLAIKMRGALTDYADWRRWLFLAFMIIFIGFGAWACINGIIQYAKKRYFDPNRDDFSEEAQEAAARAEAEERERRQRFLAQAAAELDSEEGSGDPAAKDGEDEPDEQKAPAEPEPADDAENISKNAE